MKNLDHEILIIGEGADQIRVYGEFEKTTDKGGDRVRTVCCVCKTVVDEGDGPEGPVSHTYCQMCKEVELLIIDMGLVGDEAKVYRATALKNRRVKSNGEKSNCQTPKFSEQENAATH